MRTKQRLRIGVLAAIAAVLTIGLVACSQNNADDHASVEAAATVETTASTTATETTKAEQPSAEAAVDAVQVIDGDKDGLKYVLTLPKGFEEDKDKTWPMIVLLNGYGTSYSSIKTALIAKAAVKQELPFVTLSPHRETGWDSPGTGVIKLIDEVSGTYRVDASRIYLTGFSLGGIGTWSLAGAYPDKFAAIAPIAAGRVASTYIMKLTHTPIWAFHNNGDDSMPLADHQAAIDAVRKAGDEDVTFTVYDQSGHDSWTQTYANPELYEWMLKHTLATATP
jgi:predicted peptidase